MPPRSTARVTGSESKSKEPDDRFRKLYEEFGVAWASANGSANNLITEECPFCGEEGKFYVNIATGQYCCHRGSCQAEGNHFTFLTRMHQEFLKRTTATEYSLLGKKRGGIAPQTLRNHELAFDPDLDRWLIPFKSSGENSIVNIQFYYWNQAKPNKFNLPGLTTSIYNLNKLDGTLVRPALTCEGPLDAIALDYAIGDKSRGRYDIVATPGGFKKGWEEFFRGRKVRLLYDNDKAGEQHRKKAQELLAGVADEILMLKWPEGAPEGYDLTDWVTEHGKSTSIISFINENSFKFVPQPKLRIHHGRRKSEEDKVIDWVWPNHLRTGTYCSFSGEQGTLKSTIALYLAAKYTLGEPMPTMKGDKLAWEKVLLPAGHVLYIHAEDDRDRVENGFELELGNFEHWHCMGAQTMDGGFLNVLDHLQEMKETIREFGIRFVIIDGQNSVVGAPCIATDMLARHNVTNPLHQFAQSHNICLLGIRNEDDEGRALGPQSMGDLARCLMRAENVSDPKDNPRYGKLVFPKVSDVAPELYPDIPYSVKNLGGASRQILWGKQQGLADVARKVMREKRAVGQEQ
jgi:hypothetical protein